MKFLSRLLFVFALFFVGLFFITPAKSLAAGISFSGSIATDQGAPVQGALVYLTPVGQNPSNYISTDSQGNYSFQVTSGNYFLRVRGTGNAYVGSSPVSAFQIDSATINLTQDKVFNFILPIKQISLHVQDSNGTAIAGAQILTPSFTTNSNLSLGQYGATGYSYYDTANGAAYTDTNGDTSLWLFPTPTGQTYALKITPPNGVNAASITDNVVVTNDTSLTEILPVSIHLSGKITNDQGIAVQGVLLYLTPVGQNPSNYISTDSQGNYSFQVLPGNYFLRARGAGIDFGAPRAFILDSATFSLNQDMALNFTIPAKQISLHVQDSNGTAIGGVSIVTPTYPTNSNLNIGPYTATGYSYYDNANGSASTDTNGNVTLWLFPTPTGQTYALKITPPNGSNLPSLNINNYSVTDDKSEIIILGNQPPTVSPIFGSSLNVGTAYTASSSFTDSDSTSWTATVDYGDGSGVQPLSLSGMNFSLSHVYITVGTYTVTISVTDNQGAIGIDTATITVNNAPPTANAGGSYSVNEGSDVTLNGSGTDSDGDTLTYTWDLTGGTNFTTPGQSVTFHGIDGPATKTATLQVCDTFNACTSDTATITVNNVVPTVGTITAPTAPVAVNTSINASANFTDPEVLDTHTASWNWGDGNTTTGIVTESNGSGSVSDSHTYIAAGVYTLTLTVTDNNGGVGTNTFQYASVYNPTYQGLFSAGSKYTSPAGAYTQNVSLTGVVRFGLSYKYQGTMPIGVKQFTMSFKPANFTFNATTISSLVIANSLGTLTGTGTVNGGSAIYNFLVTGNEAANTIRIKITDSSNNVVYDTQQGQVDTASPTTSVTGNIIVH